MWVCPTCLRKFNKANQSHSCITVDLGHHFADRPIVLRELYDKIEKEILKEERIERIVTRSAILFAYGKTFAAIRLQKKNMLVEFVLDKEVNEFPVYKIFTMSSARKVHYVSLHDHDDLGNELFNWLKQSFEFALKTRPKESIK